MISYIALFLYTFFNFLYLCLRHNNSFLLSIDLRENLMHLPYYNYKGTPFRSWSI